MRPAACAASMKCLSSAGVPYDASGAKGSTPSYPHPRSPGKSASGINSIAVIPSAANSGRRRSAAAYVPSRVKAPTCISYNTASDHGRPCHVLHCHGYAGSVIWLAPCTSSGLNRDAGSGTRCPSGKTKQYRSPGFAPGMSSSNQPSPIEVIGRRICASPLSNSMSTSFTPGAQREKYTFSAPISGP